MLCLRIGLAADGRLTRSSATNDINPAYTTSTTLALHYTARTAKELKGTLADRRHFKVHNAETT